MNKGKIPKGICCLSLKAWNQIPAWLCQIGTNFRATGRNAACGVLCLLACSDSSSSIVVVLREYWIPFAFRSSSCCQLPSSPEPLSKEHAAAAAGEDCQRLVEAENPGSLRVQKYGQQLQFNLCFHLLLFNKNQYLQILGVL